MKELPKKQRKHLEILSKKAGRAINKYGMFMQGERILLGISGGKDSLVLAFALASRLARLPVSYQLEAVFINWREASIQDDAYQALCSYFKELGIPLTRLDESMFPKSFKGSFNCYLCSRNKRRILFTEAFRRGLKTIALGHHLDDFIETTLINLCFHGKFESIKPVQNFFKGKIRIIRPLCEIKEKEISRASRILQAPVFNNPCPRKDINCRLVFKDIIHRLEKINRHVRENIFYAPYRLSQTNLDELARNLKD